MTLQQMRQQLAVLTEAVRNLNRMKIEGYVKNGGPTGTSFTRVEQSQGFIYTPPRTVVIVRAPVAGDDSLLVREVTYADRPAKPCDGEDPNITCYYAWENDSFEAQPPLGERAEDFSGKEYLGTTPPGFDEEYFDCKKVRGLWVLDRKGAGGGGGVRAGVVLAAVTGARTIRVQPVKFDSAIGFWTPDGPVVEAMSLWGNSRGEDFITLVRTPSGPDGSGRTWFPGPTDVIPLVQIDGEWRTMQYFVFYSKDPNTTTPAGDCAL